MLQWNEMGCGRSKSVATTDDNSDNYTKDKNSNGINNGKENKDPKSKKDRNGSKNGKVSQNSHEENSTEDSFEEKKEKSSTKTAFKDKPVLSGPLQSNITVTQSQVEFFKMLDEKIEQGPEDFPGADDEDDVNMVEVKPSS
ncbi:uncharacterized protein C1orf21 [Lingula anatina]|uniref:Uncharacterized protein C1orf21 n=1 Tax=Lingula anatina TaxID=7574 RepID=A0A1S3IXW7_LINAN|nr:uncharacterized protein C1orf21 [Lingula anatina]XP_013403039.1 uncharacterized protein C1orf21 [Lingula anatina]XP_013403040.1 uncharacterized protein C1orf21 [Lingula anatina]XP_013403041.1 uncharacterized protein C1orf21 [Lingula anatina]XP_013403042.1 uncharacterized protein C1orf21 [Lingula anatina]XP_013403043.1 uncharacterized protein C1orf21 [Lingula anatina]|eukprot:XP_013403038.1 uncharacterized protein C1orf21 [Lingula anatina]